MLTQARLKELLSYDPETGRFVRIQCGAACFVGKPAGTKDKDGYIVITVDGKTYKAHRLAWLYITGNWPPQEMDHADRCRENNIFNNLRLANRQQNCQNRTRNANNTSGYKGVYFHKRVNKWVARARINNVPYHIGCFDSAEEAYRAYVSFAQVGHDAFFSFG